jgi:hypothetical protein
MRSGSVLNPIDSGSLKEIPPEEIKEVLAKEDTLYDAFYVAREKACNMVLELIPKPEGMGASPGLRVIEVRGLALLEFILLPVCHSLTGEKPSSTY